MKEILKRAVKGDKEAFTELIISIQTDLYKIAKMRLSNEYDISEAVQNSIIKIYNYLPKLKNPEYFKTWSIKILINECNRIYRNNAKDKTEEYCDEFISDNDYETIDGKINELDFNILLKELNYNERIAVMLFYLEDLTTKQICKILEEPENTIKTRIARARNKLKKLIEERREL